MGQVSGLCGFYNGDASDDRRTPGGVAAATTLAFGDSWSLQSDKCTILECPMDVMKTAYEKCSFLRKNPFDSCHKNTDKAISRCVEHFCDCVRRQSPESSGQCGCQVMSLTAAECRHQNPSVDLSGWRSKHNCPVDCGGNGAIFRECNKRSCELTCHNRKNPNACPEVAGLCYPGCVCPDGLIRKKDRCVKPDQCRDCACDGFGDPHYFTFDRKNFTFYGNCSYVAARHKLDADHVGQERDFQVLVTNKECDIGPKTSCTEAVTVKYRNHTVVIRRSGKHGKDTVASIDGQLVNKFPIYLPWLRMERLPGQEITVLLTAIQVEVSYFIDNYGFKVQLPSQLYLNKTEGLCGSCNGNADDDFCTAKGEVVKDANQFGLSWLVRNILDGNNPPEEENCHAEPRKECQPLPPDRDPCLQLVDNPVFQMCNAVVDPLPYISACQLDVCHSVDVKMSSCNAIEAYARECTKFDVCLDWRSPNLCPVQCPTGMIHRQCGTGCLASCEPSLKNNKEPCLMSPTDGCYCPDNEAFNSKLGRCVPVDHCNPCDAEGHFRGEEWKVDNCTSCECNQKGHVACKTKECVLEECLLGQTRTILEAPKGGCCPTVICSNQQSDTCQKRPVPVCGKYQTLKVQDVGGCLRQICECLPASQCPPTGEHPPKKTGESHVLNKSGCCPFYERVCHPEQCPPRPECPPFYEVDVRNAQPPHCCPEYKCLAPKNVCVYQYQHHSKKADQKGAGIKGTGKQPQSGFERYAINATWTDGPCTKCTCKMDVLSETKTASVCQRQQCPVPDAVDLMDYVLAKTEPPAECCPLWERTACKFGNKTYQPGESWPSENPCVTSTCTRQSGGTIVNQRVVQKCPSNKCEPGYEYEAPTMGKCCGRCVEVACNLDGKIHAIGTSWSPDPCTVISCSGERGSAQLAMSQTQCATLDCPADKLFVPEGQCCPICNATESLRNCLPEALPLTQTVGYIIHNSLLHGKCANAQPVPGLTECSGFCQSKTIHQTDSLDPISQCECCQADDTKELSVDLKCADGTIWKQIIRIPTSCMCSPCSADGAEQQITVGQRAPSSQRLQRSDIIFPED